MNNDCCCYFKVERKLSQMILDGSFSGILDQGKGHLIVFEATAGDPTFTTGNEIITNAGLVVEALAGRAKNLSKLPSAPKTAKPAAESVAVKVK